jgi:hypothetical protein
MRPIFNKGSLWAYPLFGASGAAFGYWMDNVEESQIKILSQRKQSILEKRQRRAERESQEQEA